MSYVSKGATISPCGTYRYRLWREWRLHPLPAHWDWWTEDDGSPCVDGAGQQIGEPLSCVFVMLNPSTADGDQDDPTIRRCVSFAKALGYDRLEVVNLFAYRATKPADLLRLNHDDEPWGPANRLNINTALDLAGIVICAWGVHGTHLGQDETVLGWLEWWIDSLDRDVPIVALGLTKDGHPRHPLYLPANSQPVPFRASHK